MNKIFNPDCDIAVTTNMDMFKGEDMVEIETDGYGKIYFEFLYPFAYPFLFSFDGLRIPIQKGTYSGAKP